jgi:predicted dehydrogenase
MCDHTFCYTPVVSRIRELLHSGEIGDLLYLDSVRINLGLVQRDIDVIWDLAPHDLSVLDFVLPDGVVPVSVSAHGSDPIGAGRACIGYLSLQLSSGAIAHVHVNWLSPIKLRTVIIGGSKRTLVWDDLNPMHRLGIFDRGVDVTAPDELDEEERRDLLISYRSGDMVAPAHARARGAADHGRGVRRRHPHRHARPHRRPRPGCACCRSSRRRRPASPTAAPRSRWRVA